MTEAKGAYVIVVRHMGQAWFVEARYEEPIGVRRRRRWASLTDLAEGPRTADRLASALLSGTDDELTDRVAKNGITWDGWIGGGSGVRVDGAGEGEIALGTTVLLQRKLLDVGAGLTLGGAFGASSMTLSALGGVRVDPNPSSRFELLAEGGVQSMSNIGGSLLFSSVVNGGNATLPYFGVRGSLSALLGRSHTFLLGWWFNVGSTVVHTTANSTVETCFLGCSTTNEHYDVGGWTFSTGLRLGAFLH